MLGAKAQGDGHREGFPWVALLKWSWILSYCICWLREGLLKATQPPCTHAAAALLKSPRALQKERVADKRSAVTKQTRLRVWKRARLSAHGGAHSWKVMSFMIQLSHY